MRPPEAGAMLWAAFLDLSSQRGHSMSGPQSIKFSEIEAYCRLSRISLERRHIEVILALDAAWLERANATAPEGVKTLPPTSKRALNPALLDAILG